MSDALVPAGSVYAIQAYEDKELDLLAAGKFHPRIALMDKGSPLVVEGKAQMGTWSLVRGQGRFDELTNSFDCYVLCRRAKAMQFSKDGIVAVYDPISLDFKKIAAASETRGSGSAYGTEYLHWVPNVSTFATFFCANKTFRHRSVDLNTILKRWATEKVEPKVTFKCELISNAQYKWWGPVFVPTNAPIVNVPKWDDVREQVELFLHPAPTGIVSAGDAPARER